MQSNGELNQQGVDVNVRLAKLEVVKKDAIPFGANLFTCKFLLVIKSEVDQIVRYKSRFVIGRQRDRRRDYLVPSSQTVQPWSTRLLIELSELNDINVWTDDVGHA